VDIDFSGLCKVEHDSAKSKPPILVKPPIYLHILTSLLQKSEKKKEEKATLVLTGDFFFGENLPSIYEER
jgi:hypothetical protein